ncbi:MAG: 1-acyl-sn-glycerol-3-phosphate acyltransferase [Anaerolineaceae bacterium]|nr:1-acyl-sn-glycerol-3-phosphate acyltransferase [Anaerolineaceae bacterium]
MKRTGLRKLSKFIMSILANMEFKGLEHLPKEGGVIITTNHLSRMDIPFLFITPTRDDITALVTDKYKSYWFFRWFTDVAEGIWIDRTKADFTALKQSLAVLRQGRVLGISPEGTRSETGELLEGKAGTAFIAVKTGVPIVPVGLSGNDEAFGRIKRFKKANLVMRYGPAYTLPDIDRDNREESLEKAVTEIMCRIAVLLPEKYHGFYRGHPRLKELQEEQGIVE